MGQHHRAKLGPAGRAQLVSVINAGASFRAAAAVMNVAPATAHRWWWRWRHETDPERCSGGWAHDRSSRPVRCPARTSVEHEQRICEARAAHELGAGTAGGDRRSSALDRARGAGASRDLAPSACRAPDVQAL